MAKLSMENLKDISAREIRPGFFGKMLHRSQSSLAVWDIKKGSRLTGHEHLHE
jgi:hypothetical protein